MALCMCLYSYGKGMYMEAGRDRNLTNETKNRLDTNIWPAAN